MGEDDGEREGDKPVAVADEGDFGGLGFATTSGGDREDEIEAGESGGAGESEERRAKGESLAMEHLPPFDGDEEEGEN